MLHPPPPILEPKFQQQEINLKKFYVKNFTDGGWVGDRGGGGELNGHFLSGGAWATTCKNDKIFTSKIKII